MIPGLPIRNATSAIAGWTYRTAVKADTWWFFRVLGIDIKVEDEHQILSGLSATECPLVISNHQSWFDIFILQGLISRHGPMQKFLIKQELLWVPVLGWVCLALNFPVLTRKSDQAARTQDRAVAQLASRELGNEPGALLLFPEVSRYSQEKSSN